MKLRHVSLVSILLLCVACSGYVHKGKDHTRTQDVSGVIPGTNTAVVEIGFDKATNKPTVSPETIILEAGQRVVYVGADDITIKFPKENKDGQPNRSPFIKDMYKTDNAVINLVVPLSVLDDFDENENERDYFYDVRVGESDWLDPHMIVIRPQ